MNRRKFLGAAAAGGVISLFDWMGYFRRFGVPGTPKELGIAEAVAQAAATPRFLIYWSCEGGWDGYSMFNPVATRNDALGGSTYAPADQIYRPAGVSLVSGVYPVSTSGNMSYGHLAASGTTLFPDMCIVSSHHGTTFHSGGRFENHYGKYSYQLSAMRQPDERTVMQAFAEAYGSSYLLPHLSWHRWLSDGELSISDYPEGTGYYENLGPAYAHTVYAGTPQVMRDRITQIAKSRGTGRDAVIHQFVDNLHTNFMKDKNSPTVTAFASAVAQHKALVTGGATLNPTTLFTDTTLRGEFNVQAADETTTATSVNGNPARSKESPNSNVQALMTYELMTKGASIAFWIESRQIRGFDSHRSRQNVYDNKGQFNQKTIMDSNMWTPLKALVNRLKNTQYGATGKSYFDFTTIVLQSEMGRSMSGGDDDVCQHWDTSSVAFLGGAVKGGTQFGKVGSGSLDSIPMMPDGTLDPAFDPNTGVLKSGATQSPNSFVSDSGYVYATALDLAGISKPNQKGRNTRASMAFVKK
jgi:hypothetical protein